MVYAADIWYLLRSDHNKNSEHGFWTARGEASEIFMNSAIIGWRTTLEFYECRGPHRQRTNWVMQEYRITRKGLCSYSNPKVNHTTCYSFVLFFRDIFLLFSSSIRPANQLLFWWIRCRNPVYCVESFLAAEQVPNRK